MFEHGTSPESLSSSCVAHAHIHLLPCTQDLKCRLRSALPWRPVRDYASIHDIAGEDYAYLRISDEHLIVRDPRVESQWIRRQVAATLNRDDWDWCLTKDARELQQTLKKLCAFSYSNFRLL
jgi:hypothetical protein